MGCLVVVRGLFGVSSAHFYAAVNFLGSQPSTWLSSGDFWGHTYGLSKLHLQRDAV